jgi:hypothetical protein
MASKTRNPERDGSGLRELDRTAKIDHREDNTSPDLEQGETAYDHGEPRTIAIYDGREQLGYVAIGRSIRAVGAGGMEIGTFDTQEAARAAVMLSARGWRVA